MAPRPVMLVGYLTYTDEPSVPGQPPYPSTGPGFPTHPIVVPPGGAWPQPPYPSQGLPPFPSQGLPGHQPYPDQGLPGQPPGIWGPNDPRPGWGLPGQPPYPSQGPGFPTHPIVIPPDQLPPGGAIGGGSGAAPIQPIAGVPGPGGVFLAFNIPGYGVMLKPSEGWASLRAATLPVPSHPIAMPTPEPKA